MAYNRRNQRLNRSNSVTTTNLSNNNHNNMNSNNNAVHVLKDYGPSPFITDISKDTLLNDNYRTALWTGKHLQLTLMSIPVGGEIGLENHPQLDQFIRIEQGKGTVKMGNRKDRLDLVKDVGEDMAFIIPAGTWHNLYNTGDVALKLYSIYAPPQHPYATIQKTKEDADMSEHKEKGDKVSEHSLETIYLHAIRNQQESMTWYKQLLDNNKGQRYFEQIYRLKNDNLRQLMRFGQHNDIMKTNQGESYKEIENNQILNQELIESIDQSIAKEENTIQMLLELINNNTDSSTEIPEPLKRIFHNTITTSQQVIQHLKYYKSKMK